MIPATRVKALKGTQSQISALVACGLWGATVTDLGAKAYSFRDWFDYQPSRKEREEEREVWREKKRESRLRKLDNLRKSGNVPQGVPQMSPEGTNEGVPQMSGTIPVPTRPDPTINKREAAQPRVPTASAKGQRLPQNWEPKAATREFMNNRHPEIDQEHELEKFRDYWAAKSGKDATKLDWDATYRNWIRRATENTTRTQASTSQPDGRHITDWMPAQWLQEPPPDEPPTIDAEAIEQ